MSVPDKKQERSKAKTAVTLASRRLIGAAHRDAEYEILKSLMIELEKTYDDFWVVNEEFEQLVLEEVNAEHRIVNGEDIINYRNNVKRSYDEARDVFVQQKTAQDEANKYQAAEPVRASLKLDVRRIGELLEVVGENINSIYPNKQALKLDKQDLQSMLDAMCEKTLKLSLIGSSQSEQDIQLQAEMDKIIGQVYNQVRAINLCLHDCQRAEKPPSFSNQNQVHTESEYDALSNVDDSQNNATSHILSETHPGLPSSQTLAAPANDGTLNEIPSPAVNETGTSNTINASAPEFVPETSSTSMNSGLVNINQPTNVSSSPTSPSLNVSTGVPQQPQPSSSQHSSASPSPISPHPDISAGAPQPYLGSFPPHLITGTSPVYCSPPANPMPSFPQQILTGLNQQLSSSTNTPYSSMPANPSTVTTQQCLTSTYPYHHSTTVPTSSRAQYPTPLHMPHPTGLDPHVQVKKMSLPTFNGHRKDWPEFKAIWKSMAETAYQNKTALAHELKRSVKGEAIKRIRSVYVTRPEAYDVMWKKLESYYEDVGASVQAALEDLHKLKAVSEDDYKGLVELVDEVESSFSQLEEIGNLNILTMRDVDFIVELLPCHLKVEWRRKYRDMTSSGKVHPFIPFMKFLDGEREAVARIAEVQSRRRRNEFPKNDRRRHQNYYAGKQSSKKYYKCAFLSHRKDTINHSTAECKEFQKLPISGKDGKYELLKQIDACFNCFGNHRRQSCPKKDCCPCGKGQHHQLLCDSKGPKEKVDEENRDEVITRKETHSSQSDSLSLYPIYQVVVYGSNKPVTVFCDGGSNATYITHRAAERIKAKKLGKITLDVTTMGNVEKTHNTQRYEFTLRTKSGKKVTITAYGMDQITGPVSKLDYEVLRNIFPEYDPESLQRKSNYVDILLGCDFFGLHPKQEEARYGHNLSIMSGELGICLQGTHPELIERTKHDSNLVKVIHDVKVKVETYQVHLTTHPEFMPTPPPQCLTGQDQGSSNLTNTVHLISGKQEESHIAKFIEGEELGTETSPRCGGCRCGKCPIRGHTYSFKEEQELKVIRENLEYDEENRCWITGYPWIVDPNFLPNNYNAALATLEKTERTLQKDKLWASTYKEQMDDMVKRKVARQLTAQEIQEWKGPKFYISHLAVVNPKSHSTPVRIVFNSSQIYKGVSLNSCLAKGPDSYMNNLIGILLRWREEAVAVVGDIRKMFNSIFLKELEKHCHRFLWRDLEVDRPPDVFVIERVNMGDTPAPAISTEAIYKTAERFEKDSSEAAELLKKSSYVDDLIDSLPTLDCALKIAKETENMLAKGGFSVKCWQFGGEVDARTSLVQGTLHDDKLRAESGKSLSMLKGTDANLRVLGLGWDPRSDNILYEVTLNFSKKRRGMRTGANLKEIDLPNSLPTILTKRTVLEQVMKIYDPLGLVCPFTLFAKVYLREIWSRNLDWDTPLPADLTVKLIRFFTTLFKLEELRFPRRLRPEDAVGRPWLIILSDGSDLAYGYAAYVRWSLQNGLFWCRLIMAKCRIAPMNKLSTPQMELNTAVLSKRGRKVIEAEMRFDFEKVLQLVDSETVLSMINKTSTRFKVYEGVRIGEIQAATDGDLSCWAWMSGANNTADWLTRGRSPNELGKDSHWWNGPPILYKPIEKWGLKFGIQKNDVLPGEKKIRYTSTASSDAPIIDYENSSDVNKIIWVMARILSMAKHKSFKGGKTSCITTKLLREAEILLVKDVQRNLKSEVEKTDRKGRNGGRYASLNPGKDENDAYVIGQRLKNKNPMTPDATLQKLLPTRHCITRLLMERAHKECGHRGRDATLARFRQKYWVSQGSKIAQSVKSKCQLCKLRDVKLGEQEMGRLPEARVKPSPPFTYTMLDLFGPYLVRGEVQQRTSGKAYGVIFTDLVSRAVHIEAVYGYDTSSFLMALSRFASIRGWPEYIYSDPGSQLIGAERALKEAWQKIDRSELHKKGVQNGLTWVFGSADSPWHQGAVESLVKAAKRAILFALGKRRFTVPEFLTVCSEVANLLNERPIGTLPTIDSELNVLTPNSLLLGRATSKNPGGWQPYIYSKNPKTRYHLVQSAVDDFWEKWVQLYAPTLVLRRKWNVCTRNLRPGDVVIVADKNVKRGEYRLGLVKEVFPGEDSKVRRVLVSYKNFHVGNNPQEYYGISEAVTVSRSVQRLALLVPVEPNVSEDNNN